MALTRRKFLLGGLALGLAGFTYARFFEPRWLEVCAVDVPLLRARLSRPLRILHLSDFHMSRAVSPAFIERAIRRGIDCRPDLVCVTGDFVTVGERHDLARYAETLRLLPRAAPSLAVLGNHDAGAWSARYGGYATDEKIGGMLRDAGFQVLINETRPLELAGQRIVVTGLADFRSGWFNPYAAFKGTKGADVPLRLALCHNPDAKKAMKAYPWDLMLAGHTHGGQIVLPLLGAPIASVRDRHYVAGLRRWDDRWIYTTRGVGSLYGVRLNCRPELTVLTVS